jgi:hypothetical protein
LSGRRREPELSAERIDSRSQNGMRWAGKKKLRTNDYRAAQARWESTSEVSL